MAGPTFDQASTATHSGSNTATISVTTAGTNETLLLEIQVNNIHNATMTTAVAGASLVWTRLASVANPGETDHGVDITNSMTDLWTAQAPLKLTAATITATVTVTGGFTADDWALTCGAWIGASVAIFDPSASFPATAFNTPSQSANNTLVVSTLLPNDTIVFVAGCDTASGRVDVGSPLAGATKRASVFNAGGATEASAYMQDQAYSSIQTGITVGMADNFGPAQWIAVALTSDGPPGLPASLSIGSATALSLTASWSQGSGTAPTSYILQYRVTGTLPWTQITGIVTTTQLVSGLTPGTEYDFQVEALNALGNSGFTATANGTTLAFTPMAPTNVAATCVVP